MLLKIELVDVKFVLRHFLQSFPCRYACTNISQ